MKQQFRKHIFEAVEKMLSGENAEISMNEDEQILSVAFRKIGDYNGAILSQMNFMRQYDAEEAEIFQFFTVLAGGVKETFFDAIESRLNELNLNCMFGNFVLHRGLKQVFFRYALPLKADDEVYSEQALQFVWNEIYGIMTYFLGYVLIISNEPDYMTLQEYMEEMSENV